MVMKRTSPGCLKPLKPLLLKFFKDWESLGLLNTAFLVMDAG